MDAPEENSPLSRADEVRDLLRSLATLPREKVDEVRDFVAFLMERYGGEALVERSDAWTDDDLRDLTRAVLETADQAIWNEGSPDAESR